MRRTLLAAALLVGVAACSDDPTGPDDALTAAERALLAQSLFAFGFEATATDPPSADAGPVAADFDVEIDLTVQCPVAGSLDISGSLDGTVDEQTGDLAFDYELTQVHASCVVRSDDGSVELRIDGEPGTTLAYSISASEGAYDASGTLEGGVRYTSGDRSSVCTADLAWSGSGEVDGSGSFSLSGSICGTSVSVAFSKE